MAQEHCWAITQARDRHAAADQLLNWILVFMRTHCTMRTFNSDGPSGMEHALSRGVHVQRSSALSMYLPMVDIHISFIYN